MTLNSVQQGTITIGAGASSGTAAITAVDTSKAFIALTGWSMSGGDALTEVRDLGIRVSLTSATLVTANVGTTAHTGYTVGFTVVEFS